MKKITYRLIGYITITDWYGHRGWKKLEIITDERGLKEIKDNPLQDFICFGVRSVDYAYFDVYKEEEETKKNKTIIVKYEKPIASIEKGSWNLDKEEEEAFWNDWEYESIYY